MPDLGKPRAQHLEARAFARFGRSTADAARHAAAILQHEDDDENGKRQCYRAREGTIGRVRQAEEEGRLGREIAVDREARQPAQPDEPIARGLLVQRDEARAGRGWEEEPARERGKCPHRDTRVDDREDEDARMEARVGEGEHAVGEGREDRDRNELEDEACREEACREPEAAARACREGRARAG